MRLSIFFFTETESSHDLSDKGSIYKQLKSSPMEGYLELWQGFFSRWTKYYFKIHEDMLMFGPSKEQIEGKIHLKVAQIISKLDDPISFIINTGTDSLYLRAFSIDEKVKWYKRLKECQKSIEELTQNKQLFKMKMELSKDNRFKILDDLNTELWKCHAELEQRFQEVIMKTKNVMVSKNIDKLRMSIDEFKYKTSQMLQYIDQEIRDLKTKEEGKTYMGSSLKRASYEYRASGEMSNVGSQNRYDDTLYFSFYGDSKEPETLRPSNSKLVRQKPESSLSSISFNIQPKRSSENSRPFIRKSVSRQQRYDLEEQKNAIKYRLFSSNKFYKQLTTIFSKEEIRTSLPEKFTPEEGFPLAKTLSGALGTDLTKITMPVILNEPLSALQKGCEQMYYSQLLNKAEQVNDQNLRILYVSAFAVSTYSLNEGRVKKPFNPLLGETFQFIDEGRGVQFLSEQISHHPPISAFYVRSNNFQIFDNNKSTVTFSGNSIKVIPQSKTIIKLQKFQDYYTFTKCTVALTNILMGKSNIQIYGRVEIKCKEYNTAVYLEFSEDSMWNNKKCQVTGHLENNGKKLYTITGEWNKQLRAEHLQTGQSILLWVKNHPLHQQYYNFNDLALQLNHLSIHNGKNLPPTDSRFRPDQRALEYRYLDMASEEKHRLQQKQRTRKKENEKNKVEHQVLWFKPCVIQGEDIYMSNEKYWGEKMKANWKDCLDLY